MWGSLIGVVANSVKTAVGGTVRKGFSGGRKQLSSYRKTTKSRGSWGFGKMVTGRRSTKRRGFGGKSPSFNKVGNVLRHFFF